MRARGTLAAAPLLDTGFTFDADAPIISEVEPVDAPRDEDSLPVKFPVAGTDMAHSCELAHTNSEKLLARPLWLISALAVSESWCRIYEQQVVDVLLLY